MSHIFDGLQRSESERSDIDLSESQVTELLKRAEHRAASKWEASAVPEAAESVKNGAPDTIFRSIEEQAFATTPIASAVLEPMLTREPVDAFSQFRSLEISLSPQSRLPCLTDPESPAAEAIRLLSVRLQHLGRDRLLKKALITSTIPQEGKSMVAANLACALGLRTQQKVLLLEGDLRRPSLYQTFGLKRNPGLCQWLAGNSCLTKSVYHLKNAGIWLLPAGSTPSNALELLQSGELRTLMDQLAALFDWIIIDSPPILPMADTSVWMRLADWILLVTRQGTTEKPRLLKGLEAVESSKLIGALVNGSKSAVTTYY